MATKKTVTPRRKELPHNTEAEKAVLGAMLRSKAKLSDAIGALKEEDFYPENENNRMIFSAMKRLFLRNDPVDVQTLTDELINSNEITQCGGPEYLLELADSVITFTNFDKYVRIVQDQALLRNFLLTMKDIEEQYYASDIGDITSFLGNSENKLSEIAEKRKVGDFVDAKTISNQLSDELRTLQEATTDDTVTGTPTGYTRLNQLTHGFQKGQFIIVAARTGVGKTTLSLNLIYNAAIKGVPVAYFSLEMTSNELFKRLLSIESGVDFESIRSGYRLNKQNRLKLQQGCERLGETKIYVDDTSGLQILELAAKVRSLYNKEPNLGLVVVDYIGLVHTHLKNKDNRQQEVQLVSQTLKALALELKIPIIAVAQLNRNVENRDGGEPKLSDLRESGSIEQDADIVLLLHQQKVEKIDADDKNVLKKVNQEVTEKQQEVVKKEAGDNSVMIDLIVAKNRAGKTGKVPLLFCKNICLFSNPSKECEEAYSNLQNERITYGNRD